ncbi:MAG: hybrid sensor histidine kinase/response regulator [Planctomycetota bacterium]
MSVDENITLQAWMASPLAIITVGAAGAVRFINPAGIRLLQRSEEELVDRSLFDLVHALDRPALERMLAATATGERPERQEIRFRRPNDQQVTTGFSAAPSEDRSLAVCVLRDLSGEKALRPQMLHTERMASMGQIASMVAHELNNSLTGAIGCLDLLSSVDRAEQAELIRIAQTELHRSAKIVAEIKDYARDNNDMDAQVDLADLLDSLQNLIRYHKNAQRREHLEVDVAPDAPTVRGNSNQLLQALVNLVRNAFDAVAELPEERRTVVVRVARVRDVVEVAVCDRGPGVPEPQRARLFEPFFSTKEKGSGTGLGLTVVQSIASNHGGRVEVEDNPGGGAVFRLTLPASADEPAPDPSAPQQDDDPWTALAGVRMLVADDEETIRTILERTGQRHGVRLTLAADAPTAIAHLEERDYDVAFLDVRMPGGGGPAVFEWLRQHQPQLARRTVFVSGEFSVEMNHVVGADYALSMTKPYTLRSFAEAAARVLARGDGSSGDSHGGPDHA